MKKEDTKTPAEKPAKTPKAKKAPKTPKAPKELKTYPVKKLPKIYKKTYTQKQLDKKLLKKLYIPEDQKYVQDLFKESGKNKKDVALYSVYIPVFSAGSCA